MISIIIATYNAARHIRQCLASITDQSFKNIEIIIMDGGSTDNTCSIVKEFNQLSITWESGSDKGIYDALNKGTKLASGKWYYFMGADDRLLPGFSKLAAKINDEYTIYYGNSQSSYDGNSKPPYELLNGKFSKYRLAKYCINHQAVIYPATVFKKYNYNLQYKVFADYALNIQVWGDADFERLYYSIAIALYNMNGFSSFSTDDLFKKEKPGLIKKSMGWGIYFRFLYKQYKKKLLGEKE